MFVTALHLLDGVIDFEALDNGFNSLPDPDVFLTFPDFPGARSKTGVSVRNMASGSPGDLAMLQIEMKEVPADVRATIKQFPISTRRPEIGQEFLALGYPGGAPGAPATPSELQVELPSGGFRASRGQVSALFPHRQDRVMGPFPSFHFSASVPHGMSGGPVVAPDGGVIGIVSSGFDVREGEEDCAVGASIAPLFQLPYPHRDSPTGPIGNLDPSGLRVIGPTVTVQGHPDGGVEVVWSSEEHAQDR